MARKILMFGNSGSGKSTLALQLSEQDGLTQGVGWGKVGFYEASLSCPPSVGAPDVRFRT